jgi:TolA-binding protein
MRRNNEGQTSDGRSAAFTPLHRSRGRSVRRVFGALGVGALKRRERRAPVTPEPFGLRLLLALLLVAVASLHCSCSKRKETAAQRYEAAQTLFEQAAKELRNAFVETNDVAHQRMWARAADDYQAILKRYPDQTDWCTQATQRLGSLQTALTNLDEAAKTEFDQTTKELHNASAETNAVAQQKMLAQAAGNYQAILRRYPKQTYWCAQALRHLGNVHAARTNLDEAVKCYAAVVKSYPAQEWEAVQALKSAGDLLWDANRREDARPYYQQLVQRFDGTNQPSVVRLAVRGARTKLESKPNP